MTTKVETTTTRTETEPRVLRLRQPFGDRVAALLDAMEGSHLFMAEELVDLASARTRVDGQPVRALTAIAVRVLEEAMIRGGEDADDCLFEWDEAIRELIDEVLPEGASVARTITDFKTQMVAATRLQNRITEAHERSQEEIEALYARFNVLSEGMDTGAEVLRGELNAIQASRRGALDEITRGILEASSREQAMMRRQIEGTEGALGAFERSADQEKRRQALYNEALEAVGKIG